jgi:DNA-binding GntR family transcriptional regulator
MTQTNLQTAIYESLREQLFTGGIEAGSPLSEQQLAENFQASRMPVRQALAKLAHEGLITQSSRVRSAVINPTLHDLQEALELRTLLEPHAVELATPRLSWVEKETLQAACRQIQNVAQRVNKTGKFTQTDREEELYADLTFHRTLWQAADRSRLAKLCDDLHLIWRIGSPLSEDIATQAPWPISLAAEYHQKMLVAMEQGNADQARRLMHDHIQSNLVALKRLARQLPTR